MTPLRRHGALSRREALKLKGLVTAMALGSPPATRAAAPPMSFSTLERLAAPSTPPPLPPLEVIALNRAAFGPRPGDLEAFRALGATDDERLQAYVDQQLNPASIDDSLCDARIAAENLVTLDKSLPQQWADYYLASGADKLLPVKEAQTATFLRAVYSRRQLQEVLVDFWHNHFSVYGWDGAYASSTFMSYDRDVIRPNVLGNFRQMLEAVATSTAMLYFLDNYINQVAGPNENYARELFELHTLGAENYLGVGDQSTVPGYPDAPIGYVDDDVYEATRCLTGWRVNNGSSGAPGNDGTFFYYDTWHDRFQKLVLGTYIPEHQVAMKDGRDVLDALAAHPGTGRFVARKLCRRLIGDHPPDSVVNPAAALFTAQGSAPDQIRQVVRFILLSPEFKNTWGAKIKRPFEVAVSMLRAVNASFAVSDAFHLRYSRMGQELFRRRTPDGYPDVKEGWTNTTSLLYRWRLSNYLMENWMSGITVDVVGQTDPALVTASSIADFWINRLLGRPMDPPANRAVIVDFMRGSYSADAILPALEITARLPRMVALMMMAPDFQYR